MSAFYGNNKFSINLLELSMAYIIIIAGWEDQNHRVQMTSLVTKHYKTTSLDTKTNMVEKLKKKPKEMKLEKESGIAVLKCTKICLFKIHRVFSVSTHFI